MHKDQEQELERLGLALLEEEGEAVMPSATKKRVKGRNTDRSDVDADAWTAELEKAEKRRFPWGILWFSLLLVGAFLFLKWKNII